jgi:hypothetical protein
VKVQRTLHVLRYLIPLGTLVALAIGFLVAHFTAEPATLPEIAPPAESMLQPLEAWDRSRSVTGTVQAPDATPVGAALVWLRAGDEPHWTYTDASGDFHLSHLGPSPWTTSVIARGFEPMTVTLEDTGKPQTIRFARAVDPPPGLAPIPRAPLNGVVIVALPSLVDLEGYEIALTPQSRPETLGAPLPRRIETDGAGAFHVSDLALGAYTVRVLPRWARGGSWPDLVQRLAEKPAQNPASRPDKNDGLVYVHSAVSSAGELRIQLEHGSISAVIRNTENAPVEAALVIVARADDPSFVWPPLSTAADGSFTARDLPAGSYIVSVRAGAAVLEQRIDVPPRTALRAVFEPLQTSRAR